MSDEVSGELPKLLIVDDSRMVRASIIKHIRGRFSCREEVDGEAGWEAVLLDPSIELVVTDLGMPKLDGYGLLERIRTATLSRVRSLPVVVISGEEDENSREKARKLGANDFITKGISTPELLARLESLTTLGKARRELEAAKAAQAAQMAEMQAALAAAQAVAAAEPVAPAPVAPAPVPAPPPVAAQAVQAPAKPAAPAPAPEPVKAAVAAPAPVPAPAPVAPPVVAAPEPQPAPPQSVPADVEDMAPPMISPVAPPAVSAAAPTETLPAMSAPMEESEFAAAATPEMTAERPAPVTEAVPEAAASGAAGVSDISAMVIEIDDFDSVNRKYGTHVAQLITRKLSKVLAGQVRKEDTVAQLAPNQFAVLFPSISVDNCCAFAVRIQQSIEKMVMTYREERIRVRVSVGIANSVEDGLESVSNLVGLATRRAIAGREAGGNRVVTLRGELAAGAGASDSRGGGGAARTVPRVSVGHMDAGAVDRALRPGSDRVQVAGLDAARAPAAAPGAPRAPEGRTTFSLDQALQRLRQEGPSGVIPQLDDLLRTALPLLDLIESQLHAGIPIAALRQHVTDNLARRRAQVESSKP